MKNSIFNNFSIKFALQPQDHISGFFGQTSENCFLQALIRRAFSRWCGDCWCLYRQRQRQIRSYVVSVYITR